MREITRIEPTCPPLPSLKRVAAYVRVSSGKDAMLHSLSAQVSYYSGYIQRHPGWTYAGAFVDEAMTGTKDNRPQFQRMLEECRARRIQMIITKSISRFARNTVTLLETVHELKTLGIDIWFQEQSIHTLSGDGELMLTVLAAFAQEESRSASENCKWRIRGDFKKGLASPHRIYGYRFHKGVLYPKPDEARIVRMIFEDYLSGKGKEAIAEKLHERDVPLNPNSVMTLLKNRKYIGDLELQKTFVEDHLTKRQVKNEGQLPIYYVEGAHAAIVDKDVFNLVQDEISRRCEHFNVAAKPMERYTFTSMIRCGICGATYRRKIFGAAPQYKKIVWICGTYNREGKAACPSQQITESILISKTAEALGIPVFDEDVFRVKIKEIQVPAHNRLAFLFCDGSIKELDWSNPSRSESWTPEMKEKARKASNERNMRS